MKLNKNIEDYLETLIGCSFVSIKEYTTGAGEVQDLVLNIGIDYKKAKEKSLRKIQNLDINKHKGSGFGKQVLAQAKLEIETSLSKESSLVNPYSYPYAGFKEHDDSKELYIYGMLLKSHKKISIKGEYREVNSSEKTLAKRYLSSLLPISNYRQYKLNNAKELIINKVKLN